MPLNDIRLIAVDLDGTLLNSRKQISEQDQAALAEAAARGIMVVPTTGRNYSFALPVLAPLGFATTLVCSNGAIIRSSAGETHFQRLLPRRLAHDILLASVEFHQFAVLMYDHDGTSPASGFSPLQMLPAPDDTVAPREYDHSSQEAPPPLRSIADSAWARKNSHLIRQVRRLAVSEELDPLEILYAGPVSAMRELFELLRERFAGRVFEDAPAPPTHVDSLDAFSMMRTEYPSQNFSMLDVIHARCSKGLALAQLGEKLGIAREQIMAIGDNFNDLDMLEYAGTAVVMGNATEAFRADALTRRGWRLTADCDSHGVAAAVRELVL